MFSFLLFTFTTQKQAYQKWLASNPLNKNGLTTSDFQQHLNLQSNDNSVSNVVINTNTHYVTGNDALKMVPDGTLWGLPTGQRFNHIYKFDSGINGTVATVTYTNLSDGQTYTDDQGNTHKIVKIVRTISNLGDIQVGTGWGSINNGKAILFISDDPTAGIEYSGHVQVHDDYYDETGNKININGHAYVTVASLNHYPDVNDHGVAFGNMEQAKGVNGSKNYSLAGSTVTANDDGWLYSKNTNTGHGFPNWDTGNAKDEYYGAGVIDAADNGGTTVEFRTTGNQVIAPWATITTTIPQTPNPHIEVHYHFDVTFKKVLPTTKLLPDAMGKL